MIEVIIFIDPLPAEEIFLAQTASIAATVFPVSRIFIPLDWISVMKHSAIMVDGEFYEFTKDGLMRHPKGSSGAASMARKSWERRWKYFSDKSLREFRDWIDRQSKYDDETYDAATNNCHSFTTDACIFLDIGVPSQITRIKEDLSSWRYRWLAGIFASTRSTST